MQGHLYQAATAPSPDASVPESFTNDALVTQPQLKRITGNVSDMTIWRWRRAGLLPEPTNIRGRNYWRARDVHAVLNRLMAQGAMAA